MGASGSVIATSGEVFVSPELLNMSTRNVTLTALAIMQRPLGCVEVFKKGGKLLVHEYIIVDLTSEKFILAEKLGKAKQRRAGIHIALESDSGTGQCRKKVNLMGVKMQLAELVQILGSDKPDYNLFTSNCWKYAFRSAQNLVRRCIADDGIASSARESLKRELGGLLAYDRKLAPSRHRTVGLASQSSRTLITPDKLRICTYKSPTTQLMDSLSRLEFEAR